MQDHKGGVLNPETYLGSHLPRFLLSVETLNSKKHRLYADSWVVADKRASTVYVGGRTQGGHWPQAFKPLTLPPPASGLPRIWIACPCPAWCDGHC